MINRKHPRDVIDEDEKDEYHCRAERIIDHFFYLAVSRKELEKSDKAVIESYLPSLMKIILINLQFTITNFRLTARLFRKRSVLSFLSNEFGDIMVKEKTLKELLAEKNLGERIARNIDRDIKGVRYLASERENRRKLTGQKRGEGSSGSDDSDLDEWKIVPEAHHEWWHPKTASEN